VRAPTTSIRGFVLGGFTGTAVDLADAPDAVVAKNVIGLTADGVTPDVVGNGVTVARGSGIRIGGDTADGNVIVAKNEGVFVAATVTPNPTIGVTISNNKIGTNAAGTAGWAPGPMSASSPSVAPALQSTSPRRQTSSTPISRRSTLPDPDSTAPRCPRIASVYRRQGINRWAAREASASTVPRA
jgi:hypothetical protein